MQLRKLLRVATPLIIAAILIITIRVAPLSYAAPGDETTYYLLTDHLGSVDVVLDEEGSVVERRDYLPYGSERVTKTTPDATETAHKFTGKQLDPETDLYYYGARYYDPLIARFTALDPWAGDISNPQTLNKYSYVLNNPVIFIDPTGMYVMESGEVEEGDTMGSITGELNDYFGTRLSYQDIATINDVSDPNKIQIGQIIKMGAINADGSVWQRSYNASEVTIGYWNGLNDEKQRITHYGRNLFQGDLPPIEMLAIASGNYDDYGEAYCHNMGFGVYGNKDYRGEDISEGKQAIYDSSGQLVTTAEDMGTYDFQPPSGLSDYINHYTVDVLPWIRWGNAPQDSTTMGQRQAAFNAGLMNKLSIFE